MKVCFYLPNAGSFKSTEGGVQRITRITKLELEKKGIEVFLCTLPSLNNVDNDDLIVLPSSQEDSKENKLFLFDWIESNKIDVFINQYAYAKESQSLMSSVVESRAKLVNAHHNCIKCLYEHFPHIFKTNKPKWIGTIINVFNLSSLLRYVFLLKSKQKWQSSIHQSDAFVLYFDSFEKEMRDLYNLTSEKIYTIANPAAFDAIDESKLRLNRKIVYIGRIEENQKRIDKLLRIWKRLHEEFPSWFFDIVGDGTYMQNAKEYVANHNLERITFHGFKDPEPFWMDADIFTLTSDYEGFGMVLTEAQALGTVPVVFNCFSAVNQVVKNNESGVIIDNYDEEQMFQAVKSLIMDPKRLQHYKKNGLNNLKKFDKEFLATQWEKLFMDLVS